MRKLSEKECLEKIGQIYKTEGFDEVLQKYAAMSECCVSACYS